MLVIIASPRDHAARALAARWVAQEVGVVTPADLSQPGWCFDPIAPREGTAVIGGRRIPVRAIRGVITRLPAIFEADLPHIMPTDRGYVAAEMSAFLIAWLSALECPVVNRPVPPSLAGPNWRQAQWIHAAVRVGLQAPSASPRSPDTINHAQTVTVLGGQCIPLLAPFLASYATRLAALARVHLLSVRLVALDTVVTFAGADEWPDPSQPDVADALLSYLQSFRPC